MTSSAFKDHLGRPIVVVTGMGVVTSLGQGVDENWTKLTEGQSGIHPIKRFSTHELSTHICGSIDFINIEEDNIVNRSHKLAETATMEAVADSGINGDFNGPLFLAGPPAEPDWQQRFDLANQVPIEKREGSAYRQLLNLLQDKPNEKLHDSAQYGAISERLAAKFGTRGLPITLSTACASGVTAIQLGVEAIHQGRTDRALSVATDGSINAEQLIRFSLLSALSTQNDPPEKASKPFSKDRDGFVIAEGAATLVLESLEAATNRGAKIYGVIKGCGEKADHFHRTRSSPDAAPAISAIKATLADAGVDCSDVDYVNAHGTSTPENDKMEYLALSTVFGDNMASTPVSSNKSMVGHTLTSAGAVEAVFSVMTIKSGTLPPTINYDNPDPAIPLDTVPNVKRNMPVTTVLSNSFGFGGQNACLVISANPA
ncbi:MULTISPECIES: beta-ketoacyl-ACP synthase [unclassified Lentilitoribacter]|jgi:3-oxoacyl-[acyl-carrier-protein] synthase II|uniref:beta-ketoacyl-ACP synthase n=1 Tax=unclassified Lentilitoribacter TaxID=2647570 RepID=UPI0013A70A21|nr:beta-ketoacyl-ACP synthase [Lentilitoribacter sp. Alg239-R112]